MRLSLKGLGLLFLFSAQIFATEIVSVMSYNVENLFDNVHDIGKQDWTYLPKADKENETVRNYCRSIFIPFYRKVCYQLDWNDETLDHKLSNMAQAIKSYDQGKGPDIVVLQEVENKRILKRLADQYLKGLGYQEVVLLEGPDKRGIDVGIISKYPLAEAPQLHQVKFLKEQKTKRYKQTRGILQAVFKVHKNRVALFGNHWPSQANSDYQRERAALKLKKISRLVNADIVIALGDFNTLEKDYPHGLNEHILKKSLRPHFIDAAHMQDFPNDTTTHWYRGHWSRFDRILVLNQDLGKKINPLWESLEVLRDEFLLHDLEKKYKRKGKIKYRTYHDVPRTFNPITGLGFSDHLPIAMKFELLSR